MCGAQALTGWPQEDLLDQLAGASLQGGACFDRLEESILGNEEAEVRTWLDSPHSSMSAQSSKIDQFCLC